LLSETINTKYKFKNKLLKKLQIQHCFFLISLSIALLLVVPDLLKQGMFMDGQQYACVAKNLANDKGTFWKPFLSQTWSMNGKNEFLEHPPFFYYVESFAFKLFGEHYLTEKLFSLFTFFIHLFLIHLLWKQFANEQDKKHSWLPIFCFVLIPIASWVFQNNMIEELLSVFTLISVIFIVKSLQKNKINYLFLILAGFFIFFATLTKGFPGIFPVVVPVIYFIVYRERTFIKNVFYSLILLLIPLLIYLILILSFDDAKSSLEFYFKNRLLYRINDQPSTDYRLFTLVGLFQELIPLFLLSITIFLFYVRKNKSTQINKSNFKHLIFFLLVALAGSLPLMLTMVQNKFYFFPALPFCAIAFALFILPFLIAIKIEFLKYINQIKIFAVGLIFTTLLFCVFQINKYKRDELILKDVFSIIHKVGKDKKIEVEKDVYYQWNFHFYLLRFGDISIENTGNKNKFYLTNKNAEMKFEDYKNTNIQLYNYKLYELTN